MPIRDAPSRGPSPHLAESLLSYARESRIVWTTCTCTLHAHVLCSQYITYTDYAGTAYGTSEYPGPDTATSSHQATQSILASLHLHTLTFNPQHPTPLLPNQQRSQQTPPPPFRPIPSPPSFRSRPLRLSPSASHPSQDPKSTPPSTTST